MTDKNLAERARGLMDSEDTESLRVFIGNLSCRDFRKFCSLISECKIIPYEKEEIFWRYFCFLCSLNPKAFLITCLKAAKKLYGDGDISFVSTELEKYAEEVVNSERTVDKRKFLLFVMPFLKTSEEICYLWRIFSVDEPKERIRYLVAADSITSYYCIFVETGKCADDVSYINRVCNVLIQKDRALAYNLVSIIRSFYGIEDTKFRLSLRLEPYQMSYIERSENNFRKILTSL